MSAATLVRDHLAPDGVRELHPAGSNAAMRKWVSQHMRRWSHTCPDGTEVEVSAQFISVTGATLYRWKIDGRPTCPSSARRPIDEEPDWTCCQSVPDPTTTQEEPMSPAAPQERRPASTTIVVPARSTPSTTSAAVEPPPPAGALSIAVGQQFWTDYQRAALVQLGVDEAPNADLAIYLNQCQRTGLDPFARQIYMIGRRDGGGRKKWTIQTSIDGFRLIADRTGLYEGQTPQEWCGPDGVWRDVWTEKDPPVAARVGVHRRGWRDPVYAVAAWREYAVYRKENGVQVLGSFWKRMSSHMLSKVAEALALRKAFPQDLSGLYTTDELDRLNSDGEVAPDVAHIPTQQDRAQRDQHEYPRGSTSVSDAADAVADAAAAYDGPIEEPPLDWHATIDEAVRIPDLANSVAALQALYADAVAANRAGRCPNEVVHRIMSEGESARLDLARLMTPAGV